MRYYARIYVSAEAFDRFLRLHRRLKSVGDFRTRSRAIGPAAERAGTDAGC